MLFVRPTRGHSGRYRVNIIMLFVRPTRGHSGRYRVNISTLTKCTIEHVINVMCHSCIIVTHQRSLSAPLSRAQTALRGRRMYPEWLCCHSHWSSVPGRQRQSVEKLWSSCWLYACPPADLSVPADCCAYWTGPAAWCRTWTVMNQYHNYNNIISLHYIIITYNYITIIIISLVCYRRVSLSVAPNSGR